VPGVLQQDRDIQRGNMNKKVYVANLPSQVGEPELKALFSKAVRVDPGSLVQKWCFDDTLLKPSQGKYSERKQRFGQGWREWNIDLLVVLLR
jgi:hypothetical protein